jgi:hypothetical protein
MQFGHDAPPALVGRRHTGDDPREMRSVRPLRVPLILLDEVPRALNEALGVVGPFPSTTARIATARQEKAGQQFALIQITAARKRSCKSVDELDGVARHSLRRQRDGFRSTVLDDVLAEQLP